MKPKFQVTVATRTVKVYKDQDEYQCKLYENGVFVQDATYYTDDYDDAIGTAKAMANAVCSPVTA